LGESMYEFGQWVKVDFFQCRILLNTRQQQYKRLIKELSCIAVTELSSYMILKHNNVSYNSGLENRESTVLGGQRSITYDLEFIWLDPVCTI